MSLMLKSLTRFLTPIYPQAKRWLHRFNGGIFPQYHKEFSTRQPIKPLFIPNKLIIPLQQQVGLPAELLVNVGDKVLQNQLIGRSSKDPSQALVVPVHAPTSGTVTAIEAYTLPHPSGLQDLAIVIEPDHQHESIENALQVSGEHPKTAEDLKKIILDAGIIGMGGAGFPTYAKLPNDKHNIHTIIINGAECEPFISCDDMLMQIEASRIISGAMITAEALGIKNLYFGIESNKPSAIKSVQQAAKNTPIKVQTVETVYPMGGQKQLIQELLDIEVPSNGLAIDVGVLMMNVATFAAIANAVEMGAPLTSRMVSVTGLGLDAPFNINALIGTPFDELAKLAKPKSALHSPLVMGGPMMGFKVKHNSVPVIKTTNCILANPPEPVEMQMPCIRCGECMDACPINLLPQQMYWHSQAGEYEKVEKLNVFDCIECGCCSYVCPSHIPLVQYYRHAKSEIKEIHFEKDAVQLAKQRYEFRLERIEREKQEREARLKAKKQAVKKQAQADAEKGDKTSSPKSNRAVAAARAAAAKQKAAQNKSKQKTTPKANANSNEMPAARRKAIEAAKRAARTQAEQALSDTPTQMQDLTEHTEETPASKKEQARKAAIAAAKIAAEKRKAKNKAQGVSQIKEAEETTHAKASQTAKDKEDKKARAMQLAKEAAAKRKAKKDAEQAQNQSKKNREKETD